MINDKCIISKYLAYLMIIYTYASVYYLINTRNIGTPFKNSLTPEQLIIKKKAVLLRKTIFYRGVTSGIIFIIFTP